MSCLTKSRGFRLRQLRTGSERPARSTASLMRQLAAYKFGRVIRLKQLDVDAYIESCRAEPGSMSHLYPETAGSGEDCEPSGRSSERRFTRCQRPCGWVASIAVGQTPGRSAQPEPLDQFRVEFDTEPRRRRCGDPPVGDLRHRRTTSSRRRIEVTGSRVRNSMSGTCILATCM